MNTYSMTLSESQENYLETILQLIKQHAVARAKDIADRLKVNRSSVTGALRTLGERGLVNYEPYGFITLTKEGTAIADTILKRHEDLKDFFIRVLEIDPVEADEVACRLEHGISNNVIDKLLALGKRVEACEGASDTEKEKKPQKTVTLKALKPGEKAQIEKVSGEGAIKRRIRDMGVTTGSVVEVVRIAPLGDPIDIKIKGYHLSLRKEEAADILVKRV